MPAQADSAVATTASPAMTPVADKDSTLATSSPLLASVKDQRAFEHDRQRVKRAADLVRTKARKGQGVWAALSKGELYKSSRRNTAPLGSEKQKQLRRDEVDSLDGAFDDTGYDVDAFPLGSPKLPEVKLSDFKVKSGKPRKGAEGDFVFIPKRSVIVLEDSAPQDVLADEPWEHVYRSDDEESVAESLSKGMTYAAVLAK